MWAGTPFAILLGNIFSDPQFSHGLILTAIQFLALTSFALNNMDTRFKNSQAYTYWYLQHISVQLLVKMCKLPLLMVASDFSYSAMQHVSLSSIQLAQPTNQCQ